jgi:hypothetical protein
MGDYVESIKLFGTTDSFTTQIVSLFCFLDLKDSSEVILFLGGASAQGLEGILSLNQ